MKEGIHPNYPAARVACACGNTFVTRSTRGDFQVDVCGACHPFYTGTQKLIDTAGRIDRFKKRYATKPGAGAAATSGAAEKPAVAPPATPAADKPADEAVASEKAPS